MKFKRQIRRRPYRKDLSQLQPETRDNLSRNLGQLKHEVFYLRAENESLRSTKQELARLRSSMADKIFACSSKT